MREDRETSELIKDFKNIVNKTDCSLSITYNPHKTVYMEVRDYLEDNVRYEFEGIEDSLDSKLIIEILKYFINADDYLICLNKNVLWEATWYKHSAVGRYQAFGSSFENLLLRLQNIKD